jgi:hypothetical protein
VGRNLFIANRNRFRGPIPTDRVKKQIIYYRPQPTANRQQEAVNGYHRLDIESVLLSFNCLCVLLVWGKGRGGEE